MEMARFSRRGLVVGGLGAALLAACGGGAATPSTPSGSTPAATSKPAATATPASQPTAAATTAPAAATVAPTAPAPAAKPTAAPTASPAAAASPTAVAKPAAGSLTVYSGRDKALIEPLLGEFTKATGIDVKPRFGDSAQLAAAILEEGRNSPADVFFAQDAGALGAVAAKGALAPLQEPLLKRVDERFRSPKGEWVGLSGRARVVIYNTNEVKPTDLPDSVAGFTEARWKEKLGWAPTNASFQAFVTALRLLDGEAAARQWLTGMKANGARSYQNNTSIVQAVGRGEIQAGLVNHYYLFGQLKDQPNLPARNYFFRSAGAGSIINVAGAGILTTTKNAEAAAAFLDYMLTPPAQQYFANRTYEYPLLQGVKAHEQLPALAELKTPNLDLSRLADLEATLNLLRDTGVL